MTNERTPYDYVAAMIARTSQRLNIQTQAVNILVALNMSNIEPPKDWDMSLDVSQHWNWSKDEYEGPIIITIWYNWYAYRGERTWRSLAQDIARIRKAYAIERFKRTVHAETSVSNEYTGSHKYGNEATITVTCNTGSMLPSTCELVPDGVYTHEAYTEPKYKVVCK